MHYYSVYRHAYLAHHCQATVVTMCWLSMCWLSMCWTISLLPDGILCTTYHPFQAPALGAWQALQQLVLDGDVVAFLAASLCMGIAVGTLSFLFLYAQQLGAPVLLLGLMLTANCVAEIPVFFFSGTIIARLGVMTTIQLSLAAYALRFVAYMVGRIARQVDSAPYNVIHRACRGGPVCGCCWGWSCSRVCPSGAHGRQGPSTVDEWRRLGWVPRRRGCLRGAWSCS